MRKASRTALVLWAWAVTLLLIVGYLFLWNHVQNHKTGCQRSGGIEIKIQDKWECVDLR